MSLLRRSVRAFRTLFPDKEQAELLNDRGVSLAADGNFTDAFTAFQSAIDSSPGLLEAWSNLASCLQEMGSPADACKAYEFASLRGYQDARHLDNWGNALTTLGDLSEAEKKYRTALKQDPGLLEAKANLGLCLNFMGLVEEGFHYTHEAWSQRPDDSALASMALFSSLYSTQISPEELFAGHRNWPGPQAINARNHANNRDAGRILNVGYVSADFRTHSCACFLLPVLEAHDRSRVRVHAYNTATKMDAISERFRSVTDHWIDVFSFSTQQLADQISADGIDILVDCSGHTKGNRLPVFLQKPAPVQVTWLGYPSTTGLSAIDYRLSDQHADPPNIADTLHCEAVLRLPNGYHCFRPLVPTPDHSVPPSCNSGTITFGAFHNLSKVSAPTAQLWADVLSAVPNSRLLIKARALSDDKARAHIRGLLLDAGLDSDQLTILEWSDFYGRQYSDYEHVDIALDAIGYNGTTTTCEALWMGVPVITLVGDRTTSRVGASLLTQMDRTEWIAETPDAFVDIATKLASDVEELALIRGMLRQQMLRSSLGNAVQFTRMLEAAYREVWHVWCGDKSNASPTL